MLKATKSLLDNLNRERISGTDATQIYGLVQGALACMCFAVMSALIYAVALREPEASILVSSFIRIVVNLLILLSPLFYRVSVAPLRELIGDKRSSLWLRGIFGTMAMVCSFSSLKMIGMGDSSFLNSSSGVFVALLGPFILKQKNGPAAWFAIAGSIFGLYLLYHPRFDDAGPYGRALGLASGLFAAVAYLMIAKAGSSNSPRSVVFYFTLVATAVHLVVFTFFEIQWPKEMASYAMLIGAGTAASIAQIFLTRSYQHAPAAYSAAVSYLMPVFNLMFGVALFGDRPDLASWFGAVIVFGCGVVLPFVRLRQSVTKRARAAAAIAP